MSAVGGGLGAVSGEYFGNDSAFRHESC